MSASEIRVQRKITHGFIRTQPVTLTLVPRQKVKKPAGGFALEDLDPRTSQTMRLIEPTLTQGTSRPVVTVDGVERTVDFILLGEWNAEIGLSDWFLHDGLEWEVVQLVHFNGYERRAIVARRG